jgi:hypothetical protein
MPDPLRRHARRNMASFAFWVENSSHESTTSTSDRLWRVLAIASFFARFAMLNTSICDAAAKSRVYRLRRRSPRCETFRIGLLSNGTVGNIGHNCIDGLTFYRGSASHVRGRPRNALRYRTRPTFANLHILHAHPSNVAPF